MRTVYLYIDDVRNIHKDSFDYVVCICRDYISSINTIKYFAENNVPMYIDLDHDLGSDKSGYDICKMIVENQIPIRGFHIHSMNPVGIDNMRQLLTHYGYTEF